MWRLLKTPSRFEQKGTEKWSNRGCVCEYINKRVCIYIHIYTCIYVYISVKHKCCIPVDCNHMRTKKRDSSTGEEKPKKPQTQAVDRRGREQSVPNQRLGPRESHLWPWGSRCQHWQVRMAGMRGIADTGLGTGSPTGCSRIAPASTGSHLMLGSPRGFSGGWAQKELLPVFSVNAGEMRSPPLRAGIGILRQLPRGICEVFRPFAPQWRMGIAWRMRKYPYLEPWLLFRFKFFSKHSL